MPSEAATTDSKKGGSLSQQQQPLGKAASQKRKQGCWLPPDLGESRSRGEEGVRLRVQEGCSYARCLRQRLRGSVCGRVPMGQCPRDSVSWTVPTDIIYRTVIYMTVPMGQFYGVVSMGQCLQNSICRILPMAAAAPQNLSSPEYTHFGIAESRSVHHDFGFKKQTWMPANSICPTLLCPCAGASSLQSCHCRHSCLRDHEVASFPPLPARSVSPANSLPQAPVSPMCPCWALVEHLVTQLLGVPVRREERV